MHKYIEEQEHNTEYQNVQTSKENPSRYVLAENGLKKVSATTSEDRFDFSRSDDDFEELAKGHQRHQGIHKQSISTTSRNWLKDFSQRTPRYETAGP